MLYVLNSLVSDSCTNKTGGIVILKLYLKEVAALVAAVVLVGLNITSDVVWHEENQNEKELPVSECNQYIEDAAPRNNNIVQSTQCDIDAVPVVDSGLTIEYLGELTYYVGDALPDFSELLLVEGKPYTEYESETLIPYIQGFDEYPIYTDVNGMKIFIRSGKINVSLAKLDTKETIFQVPVTVFE